MNVPLHLIDAFAGGPFTGNPAAVVRLDGPRPDRWMQQVAMEMNQAETAFLHRIDDGFSLRWFTPASEVDLCGHATLASAHYLWDQGHLDRTTAARFHTRSGWLTATTAVDGAITLDFPAVSCAPANPPDNLIAALGAEPELVLHGGADLICVFGRAEQVRQLAPDLTVFARWDVRGVVVTAPADRDGVDMISRCFFPRLGVPEDPVTGSAHCALTGYWSARLGKSALVGYQASSRGGTVRCELAGNRVRLTGRAVTTMVGELRV